MPIVVEVFRDSGDGVTLDEFNLGNMVQKPIRVIFFDAILQLRKNVVLLLELADLLPGIRRAVVPVNSGKSLKSVEADNFPLIVIGLQGRRQFSPCHDAAAMMHAAFYNVALDVQNFPEKLVM